MDAAGKRRKYPGVDNFQQDLALDDGGSRTIGEAPHADLGASGCP